MLQLYAANFLFAFFLIRLKWQSNSFAPNALSPNSTGPWTRLLKVGKSLIIFINNKSRGVNEALKGFWGYRDIGKTIKRIWDTLVAASLAFETE